MPTKKERWHIKRKPKRNGRGRRLNRGRGGCKKTRKTGRGRCR